MTAEMVSRLELSLRPERVSVVVPPHLHHRIISVGAANGRSIEAEIAHVLTEAFPPVISERELLVRFTEALTVLGRLRRDKGRSNEKTIASDLHKLRGMIGGFGRLVENMRTEGLPGSDPAGEARVVAAFQELATMFEEVEREYWSLRNASEESE